MKGGGQAVLFERLLLEINQAGLSRETVLRKRGNFRRAYDGFEVDKGGWVALVIATDHPGSPRTYRASATSMPSMPADSVLASPPWASLMRRRTSFCESA